MSPTPPKQQKRPPAGLNGADWGASDAKHLIVQDMMDGIAPHDKRIYNVPRLFEELHAHQPEFRDFPFDEARHADRISRIQKTVKNLKWARDYDAKCLKEARLLHPKQTHGPTGVILWEDSKADELLDQDMAAGKHLVPNFKPGDLFGTRDECKPFGKKRFAKRIDQKKEAAKPHGANPQQVAARRAHKQRKKIKNRPQMSRKGTVDTCENEEEELTLKEHTVSDLKDICRGLGLKVGGKKAELIARIEEFESSNESSKSCPWQQTQLLTIQ